MRHFSWKHFSCLRASLLSALLCPSVETTEWGCLLTASWWVIQLDPRLRLFASSPNFQALALHGVEAAWQRLIGTLLLLLLLGVASGLRPLRMAALLLFTAAWAAIAALFYFGNLSHGFTRNTGVGVYGTLSLGCLLAAASLFRASLIDYFGQKARRQSRNSSAQKAEAQKAEAQKAEAKKAGTTYAGHA